MVKKNKLKFVSTLASALSSCFVLAPFLPLANVSCSLPWEKKSVGVDYKIYGTNNIQVELNKAGSEVYVVKDVNGKTIESSKYKLKFDAKRYDHISLEINPDNDSEWIIKWDADAFENTQVELNFIIKLIPLSTNRVVDKLSGKFSFNQKNRISVVCNSNIYAFLDSTDLGDYQRVFVKDVNGHIFSYDEIQWDIDYGRLNGKIKLDEENGHFVFLSKDLLPDDYQITLNAIVGLKKSTQLKITLHIQNTYAKLFNFEFNSKGEYSCSISLNFNSDFLKDSLPSVLNIPEYNDNGYIVNVLKDFDFANFDYSGLCWRLNTINFFCAKNILSIDNNFFSLASLEKVDMSLVYFNFSSFENLQEIGSNFFSNNESIRCNDTLSNDFIFSNTLEVIGSDFISSCPSFNCDIDLSNTKLINIPKNFMMNNSDFDRQVRLPSSVLAIGDNFISNSPNYQNGQNNLILPYSLTKIGNFFLSECSQFNQIVALPNNIEIIGEYFLNECINFNQKLTIPLSVKDVGNGFLYDCINMLSYITIYCDVRAFYDFEDSFCVAENSAPVYIYGGFKINTIDSSFFYSIVNQDKNFNFRRLQCYGLNDFLKFTLNGNHYSVASVDPEEYPSYQINSILPEFYYSSGIGISTLETIEDNFFKDCLNLNSIFIPKTLVSIGSNFLQNCTEFDSNIDFSQLVNLATIGSDFLHNCTSMAYPIDLSNSLITHISDYFMVGCKEFKFSNLILPTCLESIGSDFLAEVDSFEGLEIPENVTYIGDNFLKDAKMSGSITLHSDIEFGDNPFNFSTTAEDKILVYVPENLVETYEERFASYKNVVRVVKIS